MQAALDAKEAEMEIQRVKSEKELALKEQAQKHEKDKLEFVRGLIDPQRSISSSSSGSNQIDSVTEEFLSLTMARRSFTQATTSNSESGDSMQQTPSNGKQHADSD